VVDPGDDGGSILEFLDAQKLNVAAYLITHGHVDHVSALAEVCERYPAPILMHPLDQAWAFEPVNQLLPYYSTPRRPARIDREAAEGQHWEDAGLRYHVIFTPGHSPGSVSFFFPEEKLLFPGDVLFAGSVGRTDLRGGNARELTKSLKRLAELPDDTRVYPGHGVSTTIGSEKRGNFFMRSGAPG